MAFAKGNAVVHEVPDIYGEIVDAKLDENFDRLFLVEYDDAEGETQQRWFKEAELKSAAE